MNSTFAAVFLATLLPLVADDQSDFSEAPAETWQRYNPFGLSGFDFGNGQCRLSCAFPSAEIIGALGFGAYPRAGVIAPAVFGDAVASVDLVDWPATSDRNIDGKFFGVLTRVQSPVGIFNVNGYGLSILDMGGGNGRLQLELLVSEFGIYPLAAPVGFALDYNRSYRLVLVSRGANHIGRLFDLNDPGTPVAEIRGQDASFAAGRCGFSVSTDRLTPVEATFDNFLAWDGSPPGLTIQPGEVAGTMELVSDARRSMATDLEASADLVDGEWEKVRPGYHQVGEAVVGSVPLAGPRRFFRRIRP